MSVDASSAPPLQSVPTASELRKMTVADRERILRQAAAVAEALYRNDPALTDFEAFEVSEKEVE